MIDIGEHLLILNTILVTFISAIFLLLLLIDKDELEQLVFNNALKIATVIVTISLLGYSLYMLSIGNKNVSINIIFYGIEGMSILTLLLYYLGLKGINFEVRFKNQRLANTLTYISITISILAQISILFKFKFFENRIGFIRYDVLILIVNVILGSMIIPFYPRRKKINHKEYKKIKKEIDKTFNIMLAIYIIIMLLIVSYIVYQKLVL